MRSIQVLEVSENLNQTRRQLRERRKALSLAQQQQHAKAASQALLRSAWLQRPKRIALFLAQDGELATQDLIKTLWQRHHQVYLPVIEPKTGYLTFARYTPDTRLIPNRFKINEPVIQRAPDLVKAPQLDLIVMPLVGFDLEGRRLGMGGGFYDKTLAFKLKQPKRKPRLIGWAHACQQVKGLNFQPWDVPLDALVTENGLYKFNTHLSAR